MKLTFRSKGAFKSKTFPVLNVGILDSKGGLTTIKKSQSLLYGESEMGKKNKLWQSRYSCSRCKSSVIYNETHHLVFCMCQAPKKAEIPQERLERDFFRISEIPFSFVPEETSEVKE